ncbi:PREDICTED: uncharacterized protein LOC109124853 isoform X2 [Camelina sativa]|uniref:Uncharacterized protein LOC109124853 isoform X2 n=1 Tax=Camelina sativa TaxID=90675 RepID=A0ABM0UGI7_CAMSA|nr:PREDICTED: uncharacterized protein LOC109124853 isoform X2 [Camelina sativa]
MKTKRSRTATTNPFGKLDPLPIGGDVRRRLQSRPYFRTPPFFVKAKKETGVSGFCSFSSSSSTVSTAGFIGWYLDMVKSRPVLTKSVTSSLIYIAADLSSQQWMFFVWESASRCHHRCFSEKFRSNKYYVANLSRDYRTYQEVI